MPRPKKPKQEPNVPLQDAPSVVEKKEKLIKQMAIEPKASPKVLTEEERMDAMPLNSLADYVRYNREARALNKKYRRLKYPIKQCPIDLHPKDKIVFTRNDQPGNPLPVFLSNEYIEFKETLIPGKTYELPRVVIEYLAKKGNPVWKKFTNPDGTVESRISHYDPRFGIRNVYA